MKWNICSWNMVFVIINGRQIKYINIACIQSNQHSYLCYRQHTKNEPSFKSDPRTHTFEPMLEAFLYLQHWSDQKSNPGTLRSSFQIESAEHTRRQCWIRIPKRTYLSPVIEIQNAPMIFSYCAKVAIRRISTCLLLARSKRTLSF